MHSGSPNPPFKGRLVRFVSTPAVMERFVSIEREILQIESSVQLDLLILKELFSEYGTVSSCKVMRDPDGNSRGSGFVAFSTTEEASRALAEMNGKMVVSKPLYVALAQRKEERIARLQLSFLK